MATSRNALACLATVTATALLSSCGLAGPEAGSQGADYPTKDVRVLVPYAAGGPTDLAGRASADCLSEELDATFVVENVEGGAGAIGMTKMIAAEPDGYTLAVGTIGNIVVAPLVGQDVAYTTDDIEPVGKIYEMPSALILPPDSPYSSAEDLIAAAKENPGTIKVATPGASSLYHLALQHLAQEYAIEFSPVPFDGGAPAITAFLGGNVDAAFLEASQNVRGLTDSGDAVIVATGAPQPVPFLDGVPTLASLGYEDLVGTAAFFALTAPARTPDTVAQTLSSALSTCLTADRVVEQLTADYVPDAFVDGAATREELEAARSVYEELLSGGPGD